MDISFSDAFPCTSGATSCIQEMCFYSAPTSPSRLKSSILSGFQTEPTTPSSYEDANSNLDEFEFEISYHFNADDLRTEKNKKGEIPFDHMQEQQHRPQRQLGDSLPTMAFADELFCDGKVLPLIPQLKLPPRLRQNGNDNKRSAQSSTASSPRSPGSVLRFPFSRHSLWNDDFDPFMAALEKVKDEKRGKPKGKHGLGQVPSVSPFSGLSHKSDKKVGLLTSTQQSAAYPDEGTEAERVGSWRRKRKRGKMMKFLFGNALLGKANSQHKLDNKKAAPWKPAFLRKLGMKPGPTTQSAQWDKDGRNDKMTKMTLVFYKPKPFLCLGYGGKYVK